MPIVQWEGLSRRYSPEGAEYVGLHPTSLALWPGEVVAVVGHSGSGKSTMLNLLGLLDKPDGGRYWLEAQDVSELNDRDTSLIRRSHIGFIFQSFHLQPYRTAAENLDMALLSAGVDPILWPDLVADALASVGLERRAQVRAVDLSGGERQRVAIARSVMLRPRLLLADEPTGNLDSRTGEKVLTLLWSLRRPDATQVIVTHNPDVARRCDRILEIMDGVVHES